MYNIITIRNKAYWIRQEKGKEKIINKKLGRPPKNKSTRNDQITLRLTKEEKDLIGKVSERLKLSRTDTIIKAIKELEKSFKKAWQK